MGRERLPKGIRRLPSESLRVRVERNGQVAERVFPLHSDAAIARREQLQQAKAYLEETRRRMDASVYVSTRDAERTTLGEALTLYRDEGLRGRPENAAKDRVRINQILADNISQVSLAALRQTLIATYRDQLVRRAWEASIASALSHLANGDGPQVAQRISDLRELPRLKDAVRGAAGKERHNLLERIGAIELREKVREPARTTISNKLQLITRALNFMRGRMDGIPTIPPVSLAPASPGRDRRPTSEELKVLIDEGGKFHRLFPLAIRFAVATALRRNHVLDFRLRYLVDTPGQKKAIVFPKTKHRTKRAGIVPLTAELQAIIEDALNPAGIAQYDPDVPVFNINPLTFNTWWQRLMKSTGIIDLHFHDLRHEATSRLFEQGLSTRQVQTITGHTTNDMTDRYSHYSVDELHKVLGGGADADVILNEIAFLIGQYRALTGDINRVAALVS